MTQMGAVFWTAKATGPPEHCGVGIPLQPHKNDWPPLTRTARSNGSNRPRSRAWVLASAGPTLGRRDGGVCGSSNDPVSPTARKPPPRMNPQPTPSLCLPREMQWSCASGKWAQTARTLGPAAQTPPALSSPPLAPGRACERGSRRPEGVVCVRWGVWREDRMASPAVLHHWRRLDPEQQDVKWT